MRIGFYPPDSHEDFGEPDPDPLEPIGTGSYSALIEVAEDEPESEWAWELSGRSFAIQIGPFALVIGRLKGL